MGSFDTSGALSGATSGATVGSIAGPWGALGGALGGAALGGFGGSGGGGGGKSKKKGGKSFNPPGYSNPFGSYKYNPNSNNFESILSPEEQLGYDVDQSKLGEVRDYLPTSGNAWNKYVEDWTNTYLNQLTGKSQPQFNAQMFAKGLTPGSTGYSRGLAGLSSANANTATLGGYDLATNILNNAMNVGNFYANDLQNIYNRMYNTSRMGLAGAGFAQDEINKMNAVETQDFGLLASLLGDSLGGLDFNSLFSGGILGDGSEDSGEAGGGIDFNNLAQIFQILNSGNSGINYGSALGV